MTTAYLSLIHIYPGKRSLDLVVHILHGQVVLTLLKAFTHADYRDDAHGKEGLGLGVDVYKRQIFSPA